MTNPTCHVVFATTVFGLGSNGPETYARYLWDAFKDDSQIDFHLIAPEFNGSHPQWHASRKGRGSLDLYRNVAQTAMRIARELESTGHKVILHVNNSNLHSSLLAYQGTLWGQVNDYENVGLWGRAGEIVQRFGWRRLLTLCRRGYLERRFVRRQDLTLCNSDYTRKKILAAYHPPHPERVITLHKAVDIAFFKRPQVITGDPLNRPANATRFIFVGSDFVRKGLDTLLQAVALLPTSLDWHLTVVGASREEVQAAFPGLLSEKVAARIVFTGSLEKEKLRSILWCSQVFVLPSRAEAFGVALLEALAADLPVVAAHVGGIPEIIRNSGAGILISPDDPKALACALQQVHLWPPGEPTSEVREILEKFSTAVMVGRLRELYLQAA